LPVPDVVAVGESIGPWGRLQSFLAVEELADMLPMHEAVPAAAQAMDGFSFAHWKRGVASEVARLTRALHLRRWFHKDLYLCHFYVPEADTRAEPASWKGRIHMIDLHRLRHHPLSWRWWQVKDLAELAYSSEIGGITARDRLRFWRAYLGMDNRLVARWLAEMVRLKWSLYRRHNDRKSNRKSRQGACEGGEA
jgi:heptose I phosphotransferase